MFDDFGFGGRDDGFDPFSLMLFKALQVVSFLFFLAVLAMAPKASQGKIDSKAEFVVTMDWPDSSPDDIDLMVQDPAQNIAWYRHKEAGFLTLDRDDRGGVHDTIRINGQRVSTPIREEVLTIRGIVAGEYVVNVSQYVSVSHKPVPVNVRVQKLNPAARVIYEGQLKVDHRGDEKTAVRFTLDGKGDVIDINHREKSLLNILGSSRPVEAGK
ncbi:MAG TPA: hypothetical protein VN715_18650 [Roseiarcus sp.]|nr:hypothetical protein [Roseiarcus sp.]